MIVDYTLDRIPPQDMDSERGLIGSMMLDSATIEDVRGIVSADDIYSLDHRILFETMCRMADSGSAIDTLLLRGELDKSGRLAEIGGSSHLAEIIGSVPSSAHAEHYARAVREAGRLRRVIVAANEALRRAYGSDGDATSIHQYLLDTSSAELAGGSAGDRILTLEEVLHSVYEEAMSGGTALYPSGFSKLDE